MNSSYLRNGKGRPGPPKQMNFRKTSKGDPKNFVSFFGVILRRKTTNFRKKGGHVYPKISLPDFSTSRKKVQHSGKTSTGFFGPIFYQLIVPKWQFVTQTSQLLHVFCHNHHQNYHNYHHNYHCNSLQIIEICSVIRAKRCFWRLKKLRFCSFGSHFMGVQIFQIDSPLILYL